MKDFSRYDRNGNVVYSESVGLEGATVRHFYRYDKENRRIYYRKEVLDTIYEENIKYTNTGMTVESIFLPTYLTTYKEYNKSGRLLSEVTYDALTGVITHKQYDPYKDKYMFYRTMSPCVIYNNGDKEESNFSI